MTNIDPHVLQTVREGDRARYVSALLAPAPVRENLLALYAFDIEISVIPERVTEPLAGEIRLQWWRDVFQGAGADSRSGNPVADSILQLIRSGPLTSADLTGYLDGHSHLLHENPVPDRAALERVFEATHGAIMAMAYDLLSDHDDQEVEALIRAAARATGYAGLVLDFGKNASKRRILVPSENLKNHGIDFDELVAGHSSAGLVAMLDDFRGLAREYQSQAAALIRHADRRLMPVFAHLAALHKYLDVSEKTKHQPFARRHASNPFMLQWRVWRAARTGQI